MKPNKMKRIFSIVFMCLVLSAVASAKDVKVSSPDGSLTVTVGVDGGKAWYQVMRGGETVIGRSALGLVLKDGQGQFQDGQGDPWEP